MIPLLLQDYLVNEELPTLFDGFTLKNVKGEQSPINIYPQYLPQKKRKDDTDHFPFITVILINGEEKDEQSMNLAHLLFMAGVYDENKDNQGYRDSVNLINKIYINFKRKRMLNNKYVLEFPIKWMTNDDVTYPYFYTAIETYWSVAKMEMSNENLYV